MGQLHELPDGRKIILYTEENRLYLYTFPSWNGGNRMLLKSDYKRELTSLFYNGMLYFAYISQEEEVTADRLMKGEALRLPVRDQKVRELQMCMVGEELSLFWISEDAGNFLLNQWTPLTEQSTGQRAKKLAEWTDSFSYQILNLTEPTILLYFPKEEMFRLLQCGKGEILEVQSGKNQKKMKAMWKTLKEREHHLEEARRMAGYYRNALQEAEQKYNELAEYAGKLQKVLRELS